MDGVRVGLRDLHVAKVLQDDANGVSYDTPKKIAGAITVGVNPNTNTATLFADDGPDETAQSLGNIDVSFNAKDIPFDIQEYIFGHTLNADGTIDGASTDDAAYVALGFRALKSNGSFRYVWLYKGKFRPSQEDYNTQTDSPEFQTPSIQGSFVRRKYDQKWKHVGDDDQAGFAAGATWFNAVHEANGDAIAPTVAVSPADGASAVPTGTDIVWTFDEAIRAADVNDGNFYLIDDLGAEVAGTLSLSGDQTTVTFAPAAALAAATSYTAIASKNVRDLAGNQMAATSVTNFTTS